jgi:hypothetical protein
MQRSVDPVFRIKRFILANPSISTSKLKSRLRREQIKVSGITVYAIRKALLSDLRFLKETGFYDAWTNPIPLRRRSQHTKKPYRPWDYYSKFALDPYRVKVLATRFDFRM